MKKSILVGMILLIGCACLFAGGTSETKAVEPTGPVTIEIWSSLSGNKAKIFDSQVAKYNEIQNEVKVNVIHQGGYSILSQKVAAAANAKNMPTMITCDYLECAYYAQLGLLKPMDGIIPQSQVDNYFPAMLVDLMYDGKLYAVPYNRSMQGFYVNNDALKAAGLEKKVETWDDFAYMCREFKKQGKDYYYGYAFFHQFLFDAIAYSWGCNIGTPDGDVQFTDPKMIEMFQYFQDLYKEGLLLAQPVLVGGFEEQNGAFLSGNVATVFQTTSFIPTAKDLLKCDWSFEFIPAGDGGHAATLGGANFAVCSQASDAETKAAGKFLEYMANDEIVAEFFIGTGNLPTTRTALNTKLIQDFLVENPAYNKVIESMSYGKAAPTTSKNIRDVYDRTNDMICRIILNGEDVVSVLTEYDNEFQAEIDELKASGDFLK